MKQNQLSKEDHELNYVHEQLKLNLVLEVLNYNGPISERLPLEDDMKPKEGISATVVSSAY
ncbi:MAG: hypothetical protein ACFFAU_00435 [Candidatus Hodarchaeota archaeon]